MDAIKWTFTRAAGPTMPTRVAIDTEKIAKFLKRFHWNLKVHAEWEP